MLNASHSYEDIYNGEGEYRTLYLRNSLKIDTIEEINAIESLACDFPMLSQNKQEKMRSFQRDLHPSSANNSQSSHRSFKRFSQLSKSKDSSHKVDPDSNNFNIDEFLQLD